MTYEAREISAYSGEPFEAYEFQVGVERLRYTNAEADITTSSGAVYTATQIERDEIERTGDVRRDPLKISVARSLGIVEKFRFGPPGAVVTLTVYRAHRDETEWATIWIGRVMGVSQQGIKAEITAETVFTSLARLGLGPHYSRQCRYVLYGQGCFLSKGAHGVTGTAIAQPSSGVLTVDVASSQADGWWLGGFLTLEVAPGQIEARVIVGHAGANVTLMRAIPELTVPASVRIYAGCDRTFNTCKTKFSNELNYGGFPFIPGSTPFVGNILYKS